MKSYVLETFGCQMNVHDSQRIEDVLEGAEFAQGDDPETADLVLINTCSVREKAEHKLMSRLGRLKEIKARRPELNIVVAGCVAQQEGEALLKKAPFINLVIGPDNIPELPRLLEEQALGTPPLARTVFDLDDPQFLRPRTRAEEGVAAFVTVMKGCDERCTFCVVPTTRGSERYRPADDIVNEVKTLVESGVREVTLLGQTVNSWYDPTGPGLDVRSPTRGRDSEFAGLLRRIDNEVPDLLRLRYTSPHPRHVTPELVLAHTELAVLPSHVHLPVQSGSDRVLKRMLRRYSRASYLSSIELLRGARADMTFSTDIIVGFPGETEEDFELTLTLVKEAGFTACFAFKYSPRPNTPALKFGDSVSEADKSDRLARLFALIEEQQSAHLAGLHETEQQVLVERKSDDGLFSGRTYRNEIVHLSAPTGEDPFGDLVKVFVTRANKHSLLARMEGAEPPVARRKSRLPVVAAG